MVFEFRHYLRHSNLPGHFPVFLFLDTLDDPSIPMTFTRLKRRTFLHEKVSLHLYKTEPPRKYDVVWGLGLYTDGEVPDLRRRVR